MILGSGTQFAGHLSVLCPILLGALNMRLKHSLSHIWEEQKPLQEKSAANFISLCILSILLRTNSMSMFINLKNAADNYLVSLSTLNLFPIQDAQNIPANPLNMS